MQILEIINYFPETIRNVLIEYFEGDEEDKYITLEEIRMRTNKPLILKFNQYEEKVKKEITTEEILETLQHICENSIYSYQNQICNGYITVKGGHRVGISGSVVMEKNKVININYISSLNFRVAKQILGCSNKIIRYVIDNEKNNIYNTLIVSTPGARKNNYSS